MCKPFAATNCQLHNNSIIASPSKSLLYSGITTKILISSGSSNTRQGYISQVSTRGVTEWPTDTARQWSDLSPMKITESFDSESQSPPFYRQQQTWTTWRRSKSRYWGHHRRCQTRHWTLQIQLPKTVIVKIREGSALFGWNYLFLELQLKMLSYMWEPRCWGSLQW